MNVLLWAFTSLQLSLPLPNIHDIQVPGYDWLGGPRQRQTYYTAPVLNVLKKDGLYTCSPGYYLNQPRPCQFHNDIKSHICTYHPPSGRVMTCVQWKGLQA